MSQERVYELLKNNKDKKYTTKQIANELCIAQTSASTNCRRLLKRNEIAVVDIIVDIKYRAIPHYFWFDKEEKGD